MKRLNKDDLLKYLIKLRRKFHLEPELAFHEVKTANKIINELNNLEIPYDYQGEGTGVIGKLFSNPNNSTTIALRADMDGLPGTEKTGLNFSSKHPNIMHACGHDAHMTMLLGAARLLKQTNFKGNVIFVFQPAEEKGAGAKVIVKSGVLDNVNAIFSGHVTQHYRLGEIMLAKGIITAQSDRFLIKVQGKAGHGARPHEAKDAIVITNLLINAIQTLISREIDPMHPSVITIGKLNAGTAANVIADEAILEGTIRTTLPNVRDHIHSRLKSMATVLASLYNTNITTEIFSGYPPVINTEQETKLAYLAAKKIVGNSGVVSMEHPSMGSEDFSYYLQKIPGCYVRFGARLNEKEYYPLHSPCFDINEDVLSIGSQYYAAVAKEALRYYEKK